MVLEVLLIKVTVIIFTAQQNHFPKGIFRSYFDNSSCFYGINRVRMSPGNPGKPWKILKPWKSPGIFY